MPQTEPLLAERLKDVAAMALVGDGVLTLLMPERRVRLWYRGPAWWEAAHRQLVGRPALVRLLAATAVGVGVWIASRERAA